MMLRKKILNLTKLLILQSFPKFRKNFLFYPQNMIEISKSYLSKTKGNLYLCNYKFSMNFSHLKFKFFHEVLNLNSIKTSILLLNKMARLNIIENTFENKEELREILITISQNYISKNNKSLFYKNPSILIVFPNQTCIIQLLKKFFRNFKHRKYCYSGKKTKEIIPSANLKKIKFGKIIMPADNRNIFRDGNTDQFNIYGLIDENQLKISKTHSKSDILFATPLALKLKNKIALEHLKNIDLIWVDSLETILMQNTENFLSIIKSLIEIRMNVLYNSKGVLREGIKKGFIFTIYITSFLIPTFIFKLFSNLSISSIYFSKIPRNFSIRGILVSSKKYFLETNFLLFKNSQLFKFLKSQFQDNSSRGGEINLLIFVKNYSKLIPLRNKLHMLRKKVNLKINVFTEYIKNEKIKDSKLKIQTKFNNITIITERYFFYMRYLFLKFDFIYFQTYPDNKEFFYEIIRQGNF